MHYQIHLQNPQKLKTPNVIDRRFSFVTLILKSITNTFLRMQNYFTNTTHISSNRDAYGSFEVSHFVVLMLPIHFFFQIDFKIIILPNNNFHHLEYSK